MKNRTPAWLLAVCALGVGTGVSAQMKDPQSGKSSTAPNVSHHGIKPDVHVVTMDPLVDSVTVPGKKPTKPKPQGANSGKHVPKSKYIGETEK
jgi:hypothetical protein